MPKTTMDHDHTPKHLRIDERTHVAKPLLDQLTGTVRDTPLLAEPQVAGA